jgi:hypothetical protein
MRYTVVYKSINEQVKKGKFEFYARVKYTMFPELSNEYDSSMYPTEYE